MLRCSSFQKCLPFVLVLSMLRGQTVQKIPRFTIHDAIQAEWLRAAPNLKVDALPVADRERYQTTLRRIGAPGMPKLLPPELETPTLEIWEAKAKEAKTAQERFTALHFLNRLKSPRALTALNGLTPDDAKHWPKHLALEANIATARLQGGEVSAELQAFLNAMRKAGKVEPVRAQAARLRLVMAGREKELLPLVRATPGSVMAMMDAWNKAPWEQRKATHLALGNAISSPKAAAPWSKLGLEANFAIYQPSTHGIADRFIVGLPPLTPLLARETLLPVFKNENEFAPGVRRAAATALATLGDDLALLGSSSDASDASVAMGLLAGLRKTWCPGLARTSRGEHEGDAEGAKRPGGPPRSCQSLPQKADELRDRLLKGDDPIARSAAIEDLSKAPADLAALTTATWKDRDLEPQQTLIESYSRWKLSKEKQIELLTPWLQHPDWACRYLAYQQLVKLDSATPWPAAPKPTEREKTLLIEAERLGVAGKPLRLRITFSGQRHVTLRLDPKIAPINVANLELLVKQGFFNGHRVPRVVPDFVVQMGSPYDTMDGGPGYSVRCENSLAWYGPGSVGMALSGKDTGGSQFFITTNATPHLTGKYTRMGQVEDLDHALKILDGLELGAKIERMEVVK